MNATRLNEPETEYLVSIRQTLSLAQRRALAALVARPIYELVPLKGALDAAVALPPRSPITITSSPRLGLDATLSLAESLSARGHDAAPHLAARLIRDRSHLADVLARLRTAGVRKLFIVGGDGPPVGVIQDGLMLLREMQSMGEIFDELGVPAYPEGHVSIPRDALLSDLRAKQPLVHAMTTQMSFNAEAVAAWVTTIRSEGIALPIHLGIPGVVGLLKLTSIATRIGVADSARYLMKQRGMFGHLATRGSFGPERFLIDLAEVLVDPHADIRALHVFTMNEVAATIAWQRQMLQELGD